MWTKNPQISRSKKLPPLRVQFYFVPPPNSNPSPPPHQSYLEQTQLARTKQDHIPFHEPNSNIPLSSSYSNIRNPNPFQFRFRFKHQQQFHAFAPKMVKCSIIRQQPKQQRSQNNAFQRPRRRSLGRSVHPSPPSLAEN